MLYCSSLTCPYLLRHGHASEYTDGVDGCRDGGAALATTAPELPAPADVVTRPDDVSALARREPVSTGLWLRLAMTVLILTGLALLPLVELPAMAGTFFEPGDIGWLSVGLTPWVVGYGLVELVAALVPALRPRRIEGEFRRRPLEFAGLFVGMVFVIVFALSWLSALRGGLFDDGPPMTARALALSGGSLFALFIARTTSRFTLGNGFALSLVAMMLWTLVELGRDVHASADLADGGIIAIVLLIAAPAVIAVALAKPRLIPSQIGTRLPRRLPWPVSGIGPQQVVLGAVLTGVSILSDRLAVIDYDSPLVHWLYEQGRLDKIGFYVVVAVSVLAFGWCFARPRRVREVWRRLGVPQDELSGVTRQVFLALLLAFVAVLGIASTQYLGLSMGHAALAPIYVVAVVAFVLDAQSEWTMRRAHGGLAPAWALQRMYAVVPAVELLEAADIPVLPRSRYFRALFPFFAPYVPVVLMVPAARQAEASALLEGRLGDSRTIPKAVAVAFD